MNLYNDTLIAILDKHCPVEVKKVQSRPLQKWYTPALTRLKQETRSSERKWRKAKTACSKDVYKKKRREYSDAMKGARINFYKSSLSDNKLDIKSTFRIINKLTGDNYNDILPTHTDSKTLASE